MPHKLFVSLWKKYCSARIANTAKEWKKYILACLRAGILPPLGNMEGFAQFVDAVSKNTSIIEENESEEKHHGNV